MQLYLNGFRDTFEMTCKKHVTYMYMFGEINCLLIKFQVVILKCNANCIGTKMNEETSQQLLLCIFDMRNTFERNLIEIH